MAAKLLLVDDEEMFLEYLARRLIRRGYEVVTCLSGEAALREVEAQAFDVVILDVLMPGIDGIETLGRIKKRRLETEVILLTGRASEEAGAEGLRLGAYDCIRKPCDMEALVGKIEEACGRQSPQ